MVGILCLINYQCPREKRNKAVLVDAGKPDLTTTRRVPQKGGEKKLKKTSGISHFLPLYCLTYRQVAYTGARYHRWDAKHNAQAPAPPAFCQKMKKLM